MDRQAFRNRMQQLKQYREQNPGKTYLDFKKYAEGGEIPPSNKPIIPEEPQPYKGKLYKVYDSMLEKYVDIDEYFQLPEPKYKKMERPTIGAQVTPSEGNTMYFNRDMIKTPEDIPNSVVLHEMGHLVDGATGMNNEFLRKLGDKSKFIPFNQAKTMYPNMTRDMYDNILQGTEIKSYMNQFRNYLDQKGKLNRGNYTGSYKNLKKEIIDAPKESFNNIKAIFNLYRSPKLFNKDFQMIPIVNNTNDNTIA